MATHPFQSGIEVKQFKQVQSSISLTDRFKAFADKQQDNALLWWICSLMIIGSLFLPISFLIIYSMNGLVAPCLVLSMLSFFACIVVNMGGMGIRASVATFCFSVVLHLVMVLGTVAACAL